VVQDIHSTLKHCNVMVNGRMENVIERLTKIKFFSIFFTDDDECALNRHNCYDPYECHNTKGK